jgi:hypothetical protein
VPAQDGEQLVEVDRLDEMVIDAAAARAAPGLLVAEAGDGDDQGVGAAIVGAPPLGDLVAGEVRQVEVGWSGVGAGSSPGVGPPDALGVRTAAQGPAMR